MNTQVNWQKIRGELQRLANVEALKSEVHRIGAELRNFDIHSVLTPNANDRVKAFEKRYGELMKTIHVAQRQVDKELNRILKQIKAHRSDVTKAMTEQRTKLEKVSADFKKRFSKQAAAAATGTKKASGKKTTTEPAPTANKKTTARKKTSKKA